MYDWTELGSAIGTLLTAFFIIGCGVYAWLIVDCAVALARGDDNEQD